MPFTRNYFDLQSKNLPLIDINGTKVFSKRYMLHEKLREQFIDSALTKTSIIDISESYKCVPGKCFLCPPCCADYNIKAVIC